MHVSHRRSTINLPDDALQEVLSHLDAVDTVRASAVCRQWRRVARPRVHAIMVIANAIKRPSRPVHTFYWPPLLWPYSALLGGIVACGLAQDCNRACFAGRLYEPVLASVTGVGVLLGTLMGCMLDAMSYPWRLLGAWRENHRGFTEATRQWRARDIAHFRVRLGNV